MKNLIYLFAIISSFIPFGDCHAKSGKEIISENGLKPYVLPLLHTHWSQYFGEQDLCPVVDDYGTHTVPGCGPVAAGQVLRYWANNLTLLGMNYYLWTKPDNTEQILDVNLDSRTYDWDKMLDIYYPEDKSKTEERAAVSRLLTDLGILCEVKYSENGTATQIEYIHTILKKFFGLNPNMCLLRRGYSNYSDDEWLRIMYTELSEGRPVIVGGSGGANHIYVADGYDSEGLVHLNLGYANPEEANFGRKNNVDKYYDITDLTQNYMTEMRMIIGISPQIIYTHIDEFSNAVADELGNSINAELDAPKICRLKLSGVLSKKDIQYLSKLSAITTGQLTYVDLSDCELISDNFEGYDNGFCLQEIILPKNTKRINNGAFRGNRNLYSVTLPDGLDYIGENIFDDCRYMGNLQLPATITHISDKMFGSGKFDGISIEPNLNFSVDNNALIHLPTGRLIGMPVKTSGKYEIPQSATTIAAYAFHTQLLISELSIPKNVTSICENAVYNCKGLKNVYCYSFLPPEIEETSFYGSTSGVVLHVKKGALNAYREKWKMFNDIVEDIETEYIDDIISHGWKPVVNNLITTNWEQLDGTDVLLPVNKELNNSIYAMAQLVAYWKPSDLTGKINFKDDKFEGEPFMETDFENTSYDWSSLDLSYYGTNVYNEAAARICYDCNVATFNRAYNTVTDKSPLISFVSSALQKYYGFNQFMANVSISSLDIENLKTIIYGDLSEGHPMVVANDNNSISLLIGYDNNGNLILKEGALYRNLSFQEFSGMTGWLLYGIHLDNDDSKLTKIKLTIPGTLRLELDKLQQPVTHLAISGTLDSSDVAELKTETEGCLTYLDLKEANLPDNELSNYAFQRAINLQHVYLSENTKKIGRHAFSYCENLITVEAPNIESIDSYAFHYCRFMNPIYLGESLQYIGLNPFSANKFKEFSCYNLTYASDGEILYNADGTNIVAASGLISGGLSIKNSVKSIGQMAFRRCDAITKLIIPANIKTIEQYAFTECHSIRDVYSESTEPANLSGTGESYPFYPECSKATLHVPLGASEIYRQRGWDKFNNIIEDISISSEISIVEYEDRPSDNVMYYNLAGVKIDIHKIVTGDVYIEKSSKGTRKIIFRQIPSSE